MAMPLKVTDSAQSQKKITQHSSVPLQNSNKLNSAPSFLSFISNSKTEKLEQVKITSSQHAKTVSDSSKTTPETRRKIDKTNSNANFHGRKLWNARKTCGNSSGTHVSINDAIQEETELIGVLTKQLYLAEAQMRQIQSVLAKAKERLRSKDQEIGQLKRKVKELEAKSKNQELLRKKEQQQRRSQLGHSEYLYRRCLMLQHKIFEMEKFLSDYGLVWVGNTDGNNDTVTNNYIESCYEQLIANIEQLNLTAGKGEVHVHRNEKGSGASFKTSPCMFLRFYKNGMIVGGGPLRLYSDPSTACFISDILDGYFPSELQQTYPDGVSFKVEDHRNEMYVNLAGFPGQGYRLGKQLSGGNGSLPMSFCKTNGSCQKLSRRHVSKESLSTADPVGTLQPLSVRSPRLQDSPESLSVDLWNLRSQILASHNNNCSDVHLQSHINAELGLSSRREKRDVATRNMEYEAFIRGKRYHSKTARFPSSGRTCSSTDRSSRPSPSRVENINVHTRRSKSASLSGRRSAVSSESIIARTSTEINNTVVKASDHSTLSCAMKNPRIIKSATHTRKNAPPILHQINEATGKSGELRLKVRSLNGGTVYLVHVTADESIAKLYQLLDKAMAKIGSRTYKIVLSGYSPKRLEELELSLRESGITRDCVLHLVND